MIGRMLSLVRLVALVVGLYASPAHAAGDTLQVAYSEFPPFTYTAKNGVPAGIFVDLFQKTAALAGYPIKLVLMPNARIYYSLKRGQVDVWLGAAKVPDLHNHVLELPVESMTTTLDIWYLEGTPPVKSMRDIKNESLIVINGFNYAGLVEKALAEGASFHLLKSSGHSTAIHMLLSGRARYMLDYSKPVEVQLATFPVAGLRSHPIWNQQLAVVISKRAKNLKKVRSDLAQALVRAHGNIQGGEVAQPDESEDLKSIRWQDVAQD